MLGQYSWLRDVQHLPASGYGIYYLGITIPPRPHRRSYFIGMRMPAGPTNQLRSWSTPVPRGMNLMFRNMVSFRKPSGTWFLETCRQVASCQSGWAQPGVLLVEYRFTGFSLLFSATNTPRGVAVYQRKLDCFLHFHATVTGCLTIQLLAEKPTRFENSVSSPW